MTMPLASDYRPYHDLAAFTEGTAAYAKGDLINPYVPSSAAAQAYDRGLDYAMRLRQWNDAAVLGDTETFLPITDMDEWRSFTAANSEALLAIADLDTCFRLACNQSLIIGGGAFPLFRVGFIDAD